MFSAVDLSLDAFTTPFRRINLSIQPGELVALTGAGSSELLHALAGRTAHAGRILLDGRVLAPGSPDHTRTVGLVTGSPMGHCNLRVEEIVAMGRVPHNGYCGIDCDDVIVAAAMEWTGLTHFCKRRYRDLAPRDRHTVHFARAMVQIWEKPKQGHRYLFLDEPLEGLSTWQRRQLLHLARELTREEFGILVAVPDVEAARGFASRVLCLRNGLLAHQGDVDSVATALKKRQWLRVLPGGLARFVMPGHA